MNSPKVTVVMPAYHCGPYIREAISGILNQSFTDFEFIVCDDGSADNTWEVINEFDDPRMKKFKNQENLGYLRTYNFLIGRATGEFITCQDADDWSDHSRLAKQVAILEKIKDVALVGCNGSFFYSEKNIKPCESHPTGLVPADVSEFPFILAAVMYRRDVLEKVKGFHPYFDRLTSMDNYFILDIMSKYKAYHIDEYLYTARFNPTSNSRTFNGIRKLTIHEAYLLLRKQRRETGTDWLQEGREAELRNFEEKLAKDGRFISEKFREFAAYSIDAKRFGKALYFLFRAFARNPLGADNVRTLFYFVRRLLRIS